MTRLRQGKGPQLRLLKSSEMPKPPLEKHLIDAIREVAKRMGLDTWSGRIFVHGHKPPFLPVLGPGTPDILGVFRTGLFWGLEGKRDDKSLERESQLIWRARYPQVLVETVRTVDEAVEFWKRHRG